MRTPRELTKKDILFTAGTFRWLRKMPKWTVIVDGREFPARPLVLEAAGVPPNDPTNSHQAVAILENLGFETRYEGEPGIRRETAAPPGSSPQLPEPDSILDLVSGISASVPEEEWNRLPQDLSKNVDHYLYGSERDRE